MMVKKRQALAKSYAMEYAAPLVAALVVPECAE